MYKVLSTKNGETYKVSPSAYTLVIYKQVTGRDLFVDMQDTEDGVDITMMLDILFAMCYSFDNNLAYNDFMKRLPMSIFQDIEFFEKMINILTESFGVEKDKTPIEE